MASYTYASATAPDSPTRVEDALGRHTDFAYTSQGLTDSLIDPLGHRTTYSYATGTMAGLVSAVTERRVETWVQQAGVDSALDQVTRFTYDPNGNPLTTTSPAGAVSSYVADALGRITDVYDPLWARTGYAYDAMNRITTHTTYTSAQAHPTVPNPLASCLAAQFTCTAALVQGTTLPSQLVTQYRYTTSGAVDSILDPRNVLTGYFYDARGHVHRARDEQGSDQLAYYNVNGLLDSVRTRSGFTTHFRYDGLGRRTAMVFPPRPSPFAGDTTVIPGDSLSTTYDLLGRVLASRNLAGQAIMRSYWADGALRSKKTVTGVVDSLFYAYDATGARRLVVANGQDSVSYVYGPAGTLDTMKVWVDSSGLTNTVALRVFSFAYDGLGRRRHIGYPNAMTVDYSYDALGVLRRVYSWNPAQPWGGTDRFDFTLQADSVDPVGQLLHQTTTCNSWYSQDTRVVPCAGSQGVRSQRHRYTRQGALAFQQDELQSDSLRYDASGNLIFRYQWSGGTPARDTFAVVAGSNRIRAFRNAVSGTTVNYVHDADGARIRDSAPVAVVNAPLQRWEYFDALGRNTGFRYADGFDPNGQLAEHFQPTRCRFDPEGQPGRPCPIDATWTSYDGPNAAAMDNGWRFVTAPGVDEVLMGRFALSTSYRQTLYFVMDGQGRQLAAGDSSGFLVDADFTVDRGAWQYAGAAQNGQTFDVNRLGSGAPTGVSYFRNRSYDTRTGRWKQEDPLGVAGGLNLYQFNGNNPVAYTDPFGLKPDTISIQEHKVMGKWHHASIRITPDNQAAWLSDPRFGRDSKGRATLTIGAGPGLNSGGLSLVAGLNREKDAEPHPIGPVVAAGAGEDAVITNLLTAFGNYGNQLPYAFLPVQSSLAYNSNSFVSGILQAVGLPVPAMSANLPGYSHPAPASSFTSP